MEVVNIELLRKESCRLLNLQIELIRKMTRTNKLLNHADERQKQSMNLERANRDIAIMEGELKKLHELDMVLAVIGTVKSGKSTTNNAIVGLEVLPNRNRPMTALPTIIRHTPKQKEPVLRFRKNTALNEFISLLASKLETSEGLELLSSADQQEDLQAVASAIRSGMTVGVEYNREQGIFEFLKTLNDLVRLSTALGVDFPFSEFESPDELPIIEVEFQHLRGSEEAHGRLSLLDTPGPNEEGQFALKPMMKNQLRRASGVVAVLDYTQLKSESDAEVRRELLEIADVAKGRFSVFVNKFDQKDRHSDGVNEVKSLVANELLKGKISEDDVYPVSSRYAYLANRARTDLALNQVLPDVEGSPWVEDFAEEGLGRRWQRDIHDIEKVREAIDGLWEDSLFDLPLERVIQRAHTQAAVMAIDSAASKLVKSGTDIYNFLGIRETALQKSAEELKNYIKELQSQQDEVNQLEKTFQSSLEKLGVDFKYGFEEMTIQAGKSLKGSLEQYFKEGRLQAYNELENKDVQRQQDANEYRGLFGGFLNHLNKIVNRDKNKSDFDPDSPKIEFSDRSSARKLLNKIDKAIEVQYKNVNDAMLKSMSSMNEELDKQSAVLENQANSILEKLSGNMKDQGFELRLNLPRRKAIDIDIDNQQVLDNMVSEKSRTVTKQRRQSGAWGTVCGWFGTSDWGWESYNVEEEYFQIDIEKIRNRVLRASSEIFKNTTNVIQQDVIDPVDKSCGEFFCELKSMLEEIRGDLLQGLSDGQRTEKEQEDLARCLADLKQDNSNSENDLQHLKRESEMALSTGLVSTKDKSMEVEL